MRKPKSKILLSFIFLAAAGALIFARQSLSYSTNNTHPFLTEKIAKFHNLKDKKSRISKEEIGWMKKGAVQEDDPPRWINHFYDPVHKIGWTGKHYGNLSEKVGYEKGADMAPKPAIASIDWVENQEYQAAYGRQYGNRTWQKAVKSYIDGDKETAFLALGDILHLIEDLSVPAHTRNDSHPGLDKDPGSPYEDYAKDITNFHEDKVTIVSDLVKENRAIPNFQKLSDAFNYLADYSNKNFFSEDTIDNEDFMEPNVKELKKETKMIGEEKIIFLYDNDIKSYLAFLNNKTKKYSIRDKEFILPSYRSHLFSKAVLTGAGVIDLFFKDVEKYKKNPELLEPIVPDSDEPFLDAIKTAHKIIAIKANDFLDVVWISALKKGISAQKTIGVAVDGVKSGIGSVADAIKNTLRRPKIAPTHNLATAVDVPGILSSVKPTISKTSSELKPRTSAPKEKPFPRKLSPKRFVKQPKEASAPSEQTPETAKRPPRQENAEQKKAQDSGRSSAARPEISPAPVFSVASPFVAMAIGSYKKKEVIEEEKPKEEKLQEKKDETSPEAPVVLSPSDFSRIFTSSDIVFSGMAEASSTLSANFDGVAFATTTADSNGAWTLPLSFGEGTTTIGFTSSDSAGNISSSTEISLFVDSTPPEVSLLFSECSDSLSSETCLISATTTLHILWSSPEKDVNYFIINSNGAVSTTMATSTTIADIEDNSTYSFSVSAIDRAGNVSATSTRTAEISTVPVVINEIAWMGNGSKTVSDEWIELYNKTNHDINLSGWTLYSETDMKPYIKLSKTIPANGYYLIERTDDNTVRDVPADLVYSFGSGKGMGLSNYGEIMVLARGSTTVERIPRWAGLYGDWLGGLSINGVYRTMERRDPNRPGLERSNWGYNDAFIRNGLSADGKRINGTPGRRNSVNYSLPVRNKNIHLTKENSPYFVNWRASSFSNGTVLSIEPGTVIKFGHGAGINFEKGAILKAEGTAELPIVFTSVYDNSVGGEIISDRFPLPGDWGGISINGADSVFKHVSFKYGGRLSTGKIDHSPGCNFCYSNLNISGGKVSVSDSSFENSWRNGLRIENATSSVTNSSFVNNGKDEGRWAGLYLARGVSVIDSNKFSGNLNGMVTVNGSTTATSNEISSSTEFAISSAYSRTLFSDNRGSGNGINGIRLFGDVVRRGETVTLAPNPLPYVVKYPLRAFSPASSAVVILPGVVFKSDAPLTISGKLEIKGKKKDDVIFTSIFDDSVGGKTLAHSKSFRLNSGGIRITKGGFLDARGFTIKYSDFYGGFYRSNSAAIFLDRADGNISDALFEDNYHFGVYASGRLNSLSVKNTVFRGRKGMKWDRARSGALAALNATTTLENVSFEDNLMGVYGDPSLHYNVKNVTFSGNGATTSLGGLW